MYGGKRNVARKAYTGRSNGYVRGRTAGTKRYPLSKVGGAYKSKPKAAARFATVAYTRDVETKYSDKAIQGGGGTLTASNQGGGWGLVSGTWRSINFGGTTTPATILQQDLMKGVFQDTTASGRIGNRIRVNCLKLKISMNAAYLLNATTGAENAMNGEAVIDSTPLELRQYMRTTYRVMVIRDTQVNSTENEIPYSVVMETDPTTGLAGVHSELKIANMGRFNILHDQLVELRADMPMKTLALEFNNLGNVRYNGPQTTLAPTPALTDTGVYIIFAVWTQGTLTTVSPTYAPVIDGVNVSRRLCFTDA